MQKIQNLEELEVELGKKMQFKTKKQRTISVLFYAICAFSGTFSLIFMCSAFGLFDLNDHIRQAIASIPGSTLVLTVSPFLLLFLVVMRGKETLSECKSYYHDYYVVRITSVQTRKLEDEQRLRVELLQKQIALIKSQTNAKVHNIISGCNTAILQYLKSIDTSQDPELKHMVKNARERVMVAYDANTYSLLLDDHVFVDYGI
jgi:hypothetical protein